MQPGAADGALLRWLAGAPWPAVGPFNAVHCPIRFEFVPWLFFRLNFGTSGSSVLLGAGFPRAVLLRAAPAGAEVGHTQSIVPSEARVVAVSAGQRAALVLAPSPVAAACASAREPVAAAAAAAAAATAAIVRAAHGDVSAVRPSVLVDAGLVLVVAAAAAAAGVGAPTPAAPQRARHRGRRAAGAAGRPALLAPRIAAAALVAAEAAAAAAAGVAAAIALLRIRRRGARRRRAAAVGRALAPQDPRLLLPWGREEGRAGVRRAARLDRRG
jgi:hypothetical protein